MDTVGIHVLKPGQHHPLLQLSIGMKLALVPVSVGVLESVSDLCAWILQHHTSLRSQLEGSSLYVQKRTCHALAGYQRPLGSSR